METRKGTEEKQRKKSLVFNFTFLDYSVGEHKGKMDANS